MKLSDYATVIRSKNSGPFEITFDILFKDKESYQLFKDKQLINKESMAKLYQIKQEDIHHLVYFDYALGIKITMARKYSSGSFRDRDVYGAQQGALLQEYNFN